MKKECSVELMWKTHMCTITVHGQCADCSPGQHRQTAALCSSAEGNTSLTNGHTPLVRLNPGIVRLLHERTYVHAAVGPVFWLRRKQISLCGVRTCVSVSAPTLVPAPVMFCYLTPTLGFNCWATEYLRLFTFSSVQTWRVLFPNDPSAVYLFIYFYCDVC